VYSPVFGLLLGIRDARESDECKPNACADKQKDPQRGQATALPQRAELELNRASADASGKLLASSEVHVPEQSAANSAPLERSTFSSQLCKAALEEVDMVGGNALSPEAGQPNSSPSLTSAAEIAAASHAAPIVSWSSDLEARLAANEAEWLKNRPKRALW
jgi:hypothetical protein